MQIVISARMKKNVEVFKMWTGIRQDPNKYGRIPDPPEPPECPEFWSEDCYGCTGYEECKKEWEAQDDE